MVPNCLQKGLSRSVLPQPCDAVAPFEAVLQQTQFSLQPHRQLVGIQLGVRAAPDGHLATIGPMTESSNMHAEIMPDLYSTSWLAWLLANS